MKVKRGRNTYSLLLLLFFLSPSLSLFWNKPSKIQIICVKHKNVWQYFINIRKYINLPYTTVATMINDYNISNFDWDYNAPMQMKSSVFKPICKGNKIYQTADISPVSVISQHYSILFQPTLSNNGTNWQIDRFQLLILHILHYKCKAYSATLQNYSNLANQPQQIYHTGIYRYCKKNLT